MSSDPKASVEATTTTGEEVVVAAVEEVDTSDSAVDENVKKQRDALTHQPDEYPMRYLSFQLFGSEVNLNPFTSFFGFSFLWALSIWCMVVPDRK